MVASAAARSSRRRRGRSPGIRAVVIARVRRAAGRLSSLDFPSPANAGVRGQLADSGCRVRSGARRPFRSSRTGVHQLDSRRDVNVDVDSRRREISLGKRPVDCTIDTSPVEVVDGSSICVSGFPAAVHLYGSLVGATTYRCRPRVVPLCAAGTFGQPASLENSRVVCARRKRTLVRSYWSGRERVRGMQPPFSKDYIQLLKATFRGRSYYGGPDLCCPECGAFFYPEIVAALINMLNTHHRLVDTFRIAR
ncbi:uncharacterized protein LOC125546886 isoform X2 [Triticum urartu]|uniref:Uncharacterized protein n=1 Tax=Triticum urartu TaxID=4572 RepID=A0A8R7JX26_TRIUA|nr:uncharacterized protein LOC125546886 isoform X2 [Triticum urartu]